MQESIIKDFIVEKNENGGFVITINGEIQSNAKEAIIEICKEIGLDINDKWTTNQLGARLKNFIDMKGKIREIMQEIANEINKTPAITFCPIIGSTKRICTGDLYGIHRKLIEDIFNAPVYDLNQIMLRLTVIDSFYSTNAKYSYFSILEMAEAIWDLGTENDAQEYFYSLVKGGKDYKGLFSKHYGIKKNLSRGDMMMSLLSKYAYYALLKDKKKYPLGFPIYDRLVRNFYPKVCKLLGLKSSMPRNTSIEDYILSMDKLRKALFINSALFNGLQQYDILDAYLWRMGKFEEGNLSLLLCRCDYEMFVNNLGLKSVSSNFEEQVIKGCENVNIKPFKGLKNETYLDKLLEHWRLYHAEKKN